MLVFKFDPSDDELDAETVSETDLLKNTLVRLDAVTDELSMIEGSTTER